MTHYPFKARFAAPLALLFAMSACASPPSEVPSPRQAGTNPVTLDIQAEIGAEPAESKYLEIRKFEWVDRIFTVRGDVTQETRFLAFNEAAEAAFQELTKNPVDQETEKSLRIFSLVQDLRESGAVRHDGPEGQPAWQSRKLKSYSSDLGMLHIVHFQDGEAADLDNGDPGEEWYDKDGRLIAARYCNSDKQGQCLDLYQLVRLAERKGGVGVNTEESVSRMGVGPFSEPQRLP